MRNHVANRKNVNSAQVCVIRRKSIHFPEFAPKLMHGVFKAILDATLSAAADLV